MTIAKQMLSQVELGKKVDENSTLLRKAFDDAENNKPPPIFPDGVVFCDENHSVATLGAVLVMMKAAPADDSIAFQFVARLESY